MLLVSAQGDLIERFPLISFRCLSDDHAHCKDVMVDGMILHIGHYEDYVEYLKSKSDQEHPTITLLSRTDRGFEPSELISLSTISPETEAKALGSAINALAASRNAGYVVCVIPGTFDLVLAKIHPIAERIKSALSYTTGKYDLRSLEEFRGLGDSLSRELASILLNSAYRMRVTPEVFICYADE